VLTAPRPARADDLEPVLRLLELCKLPTGGVEDFLGDGYAIVERDPSSLPDAGTPGRALVGVCGIEVHGSIGLLRSLAVDPSHRRHAAGRALVEDRLDWARRRGLREVFLLTTDADRYFEPFGFNRRPREEAPPEIAGSLEFRTLCPNTAVVMSMPLSNRGRP